MRSRPIIRRIIAAVRDLGPVECADHAPVAQDHHAVGALLDLVEAVRDEDDADAVGLQAAMTRSRRSVSVASGWRSARP